jgi:hypothetical protein
MQDSCIPSRAVPNGTIGEQLPKFLCTVQPCCKDQDHRMPDNNPEKYSEEGIQEEHDDSDAGSDRDHKKRAYVDRPPVFAFIIVDETCRRKEPPALFFCHKGYFSREYIK